MKSFICILAFLSFYFSSKGQNITVPCQNYTQNFSRDTINKTQTIFSKLNFGLFASSITSDSIISNIQKNISSFNSMDIILDTKKKITN